MLQYQGIELKNNRKKPDYFARRAKQEKYPARSVYKLKEIRQKFNIIPKNSNLLEIGAAPGSWSLYLLETIGKGGHLVAVDLNQLDIATGHQNLTVLQGDFCSKENLSGIRDKGPYDGILSDAAPSTTGNRFVDTERSLHLAEGVLELCFRDNPFLLKPAGFCVIKVFSGGQEKELLDMVCKHFAKAKFFKPKACRSESFETYLVGTGKLT